jgi:hypothetical protein
MCVHAPYTHKSNTSSSSPRSRSARNAMRNVPPKGLIISQRAASRPPAAITMIASPCTPCNCYCRGGFFGRDPLTTAERRFSAFSAALSDSSNWRICNYFLPDPANFFPTNDVLRSGVLKLCCINHLTLDRPLVGAADDFSNTLIAPVALNWHQ